MDAHSMPDTAPPSDIGSPPHRPVQNLDVYPTKSHSGNVKRHAQFWFEDGNYTVQAGDTLFKLHKSLLLRASAIFYDQFALAGPTASSEGTDEKPHILPQMTGDEFEVFCKAVYATWGGDDKLTTPELVRLIGVSDFFQAHSIYVRAVAKLKKKRLSLVDRIAHAKQFHVDDWAEPAFVTLVQTQHTLSDEEAVRIGWDAAFRIATAQKAVVAHRLSRVHNVNQAGCCNTCQANYVRNAVVQVGQFLCSPPPNNLASSADNQAFLDYLRAEIKSRIPNVGQCGQQNCQSWPTAEHIKVWFDFVKEEEMIKKIIADGL